MLYFIGCSYALLGRGYSSVEYVTSLRNIGEQTLAGHLEDVIRRSTSKGKVDIKEIISFYSNYSGS